MTHKARSEAGGSRAPTTASRSRRQNSKGQSRLFAVSGAWRFSEAQIVEAEVEVVDRRERYAAGLNTSPPTGLLQAQSALVCRASRTRSVSCGARPTSRFVA